MIISHVSLSRPLVKIKTPSVITLSYLSLLAPGYRIIETRNPSINQCPNYSQVNAYQSINSTTVTLYRYLTFTKLSVRDNDVRINGKELLESSC